MAMNPILQAITGKSMTGNALGQARQIVNLIKSSANPQAMVSNMLGSNPQVQRIINQYGGDPRTAFYRYAESNGVDPDEILNMLK